MRRVVVTGLGAITPFGVGIECMWQGLLSNAVATRALPSRLRRNNQPSHVAGMVPREDDPETGVGDVSPDVVFRPLDYMDVSTSARTPLFMQYAIAATRMALDDAGWVPDTEEKQERTGVAVGSGMGSMSDIADGSRTLENQGHRRISPFFVPRILINLAAGHISIIHKLKGPNHATATACATGAHSIGDASNFIRLGHADVMVAGGTESCLDPLALSGFARAKALSTQSNDAPERASRPFDRQREGFVMGEGAGLMILEEREHAIARGARIYAELSGYGLTGDAYHMTAPPPDGDGAKRAMASCLRTAAVDARDVAYVNAHATSTPLGDVIEHKAICAILEDAVDAGSLAISSSKGALGHLLGASGSVEAIATVLALYHGVVPPTANLESPDSALDGRAHLISHTAVPWEINHAISNSFGFGGTNVSLLFSRATPSPSSRA